MKSCAASFGWKRLRGLVFLVSTLGDTTKPGAREVARDVTKDRCNALLRSAVGVADLDVETSMWRLEGTQSDRCSL